MVSSETVIGIQDCTPSWGFHRVGENDYHMSQVTSLEQGNYS